MLPVCLFGDSFRPRDPGCVKVTEMPPPAAPSSPSSITDAAAAIARATEYYEDADPVNIGSGQEISIKDLVTKICQLCNFQGRVQWDATKPDGQPRRCLDTTRARERFGFQAKTSLDEGLRETIRWYEQHRETVATAEAA